MKRHILTIITLFVFTLIGYSQQSYIVTSNKSLNVRSSASTNATVIGTLNSGEKINVTNITNNDWAEIKYGNKKGYVSQKYIKPASTNVQQSDSDIIDMLDMSNISKFSLPTLNGFLAEYLQWIIIALIAITFFFFRNSQGWVPMVLIFIVAVLEFFYLQENSAWSVITGHGFWWGVVIFIAYGFVLYMQLISSMLPIMYYIFATQYSAWSRVFGHILAIVAPIVIVIFFDENPIANYIPHIIIGMLALQYVVAIIQGFIYGEPIAGIFLMPMATIIFVALLIAVLQYLSFVLIVVIVLGALSSSGRSYIGSFTGSDGTKYNVYR